MPTASDQVVALNWMTGNTKREDSLGPINWDALVQYATNIKGQRDGNRDWITCQLSSEYNMGGRNLVRRLDFQDGTHWIARIQLDEHTAESTERLVHEVHTMAVVRERSEIPVPEVYAYESNCDNSVAVPFILMEFVPGDTAMDSFGGYNVHRGETPPQFKRKFHAAMADIQVQMSAIRFPRIGSVIKSLDGTYSIGPLPGIGGPFESAAHFFEAWADNARFPYSEEFIRERTPKDLADEVLECIKAFPSRLKQSIPNLRFREGPFPLFHTDFYNSNIIINPQHDILSVIDWEDALVAPWELVEFAKGLSIVPPAMDGPLYREDEVRRQLLAERMKYVELAKDAEKARGLDNCLSAILEDSNAQHFAHALWLYEDGRIGYYGAILDAFGENNGSE
ncbi:kinase-like protein [Xylaria palmicola]|nr:kinase-like protein [Xylaria palmicola]